MCLWRRILSQPAWVYAARHLKATVIVLRQECIQAIYVECESMCGENKKKKREKLTDIEYDSQHGKSCSTTSNTFAQEFHI